MTAVGLQLDKLYHVQRRHLKADAIMYSGTMSACGERQPWMALLREMKQCFACARQHSMGICEKGLHGRLQLTASRTYRCAGYWQGQRSAAWAS